MLTISGGSPRWPAFSLWDGRKGARSGIIESTGILGTPEDRVVGYQVAVLHGVAHRAIGRMNDPTSVKDSSEVGVITAADSFLEQRVERVTMIIAQAIVGCEGHSMRCLDRSDHVAEIQYCDQSLPLTRRHHDDHCVGHHA